MLSLRVDVKNTVHYTTSFTFKLSTVKFNVIDFKI